MSLLTFEEFQEIVMSDECLECPGCLTSQAWEEAFLGPLGTRIHFQCRYCGLPWSLQEEEDVSWPK